MKEPKLLSEDERAQLLRTASEIATKAYAPYSNFRVGSAILGEKDTYVGTNVENASYGLTLCAERSAFAAAIAAGEDNIRAIAVACIDAKAGSDLSERMPCGACRQWMIELAPNAEILVLGLEHPLHVEDLLPNPFKLGASGNSK